MKRLFVIYFIVVFGFVPYANLFATTDAERKIIEAQLQNLERQILQNQVKLEDTQLERQSLERDVTILEKQIENAQLGIQARALAIRQLTDQISDKETVVEVLSDRQDRQRQSLGELIRQTNVVDDYSLVEVMLSNQNFSEFFEDFESYRSVNESLKESIILLQEIKLDTLAQKESLEHKQLTEAELKRIQELEKQSIEAREREKNQILQVTKGEEASYQQLLAEQQKTAAQLRARLFELLGGGGGIPFGQAVELAQVASRITGTPTSLILAILEQESSYGQNLGTCTMGDVASGRDIMHPDRDKPVFLAIAAALGFNPATQPVSCPLRRADGTRIGWGGAMGPSQFIPSTWAIYGGFKNNGAGWSYSASDDAIRALLGKSTPSSPFTNQDAFVATALLLRDNGANGSYAADRMAALRYYAGWGGANNPENAFYGDGVMSRKTRIDNEIKILSGNN